jgi:hypothetical protein
MIDVEPLIREELQLRVPPVDPGIASWPDILRRSGETQRRRRRRLTATVITGAAVVALAISPLGGAVTRAVGGFSDWLLGTPGTSPPRAAQRQFKTTSPFPGNPRLRELLHVTLDGRRFVLYGFETGQVVCLRVAVQTLAGAGPQAACVSRADLRRSHDLVLPVKANLTFGHLGRLPPTLPKYVLTFGVAAHDVVSVGVQTDRGTSRAAVRNGAFLHVFRPLRRGVWRAPRSRAAQRGERAFRSALRSRGSRRCAPDWGRRGRARSRAPSTAERSAGSSTAKRADSRRRKPTSTSAVAAAATHG